MKKKILVRGPALSRSGYGEEVRFALKALRNYPDIFDILVVNTSWGRTGNISEQSEEKKWIENKIVETHNRLQNKEQVDISLQVTIPNEFEKLAPVNIGYTAGIETTRIAPQWIEKAALMDKIITISEHSKQVFNDTTYQAVKNDTGERVLLKNVTPVDVVGFPAKKTKSVDLKLDLPCEFNFLSVVQWGVRKNLETTIRCFVEEFKNEEVGLVIKTNTVKNSIMDRMMTETRLLNVLASLPQDRKCKIHLLHGNMTEDEMSALYLHPKIKGFISTTHGEGFGIPIFEAACSGLPVIAPFWSGHIDFLKAPKKDKETGKTKLKPHCVKIDYELKTIQKEAVWDGVVQADSQWAFPKPHSVREGMRELVKNYGPNLSQAKKLQEHLLKTLTEEKLYKQFVESVLGKEVVQKEEIPLENIPKISIITSVFKGDEFIRPFLEDITRQSIFKEKCELILINPNSPGNEELVIKEFIDKFPQNIVYKRLENDPGIYACWNIAAKLATGEFLTNANLDDRKAPNALEVLAKRLVDNDEVDVVYANNLLTSQPNETWEKNTSTALYPSENFSVEAMLRGNPPHCMPMWRKSLHEKFGYFEEKYRSASDWEFWLRCTMQDVKMAKVDEPLGLYYFNPKGMSTNQENNSWKREEEKEIFKKYITIFKEKAANA
jgi:glycosyltransferase involved in cell wall biosynthesis